ncbi:MAG: hypothetical protein JW982_11130 [Spirochaetes bacterium]|nr:hypothetical protein [Spirochaetota bacterium]
MKKFIILLFSITAFLLFSCDNEPLFTEIVDSNLQLVLKGTFESNGPKAWNPVTPTLFMLDIAEIEMNGDSFANKRATYLTTLNNTTDPFYNGAGVSYPCNDLYNGKVYSKVQIYFRKMIFNGTSVITTFREKDVQGFDFNEYQIYTQADYDAENFNNLVFPLTVPLPYNLKYDRNKYYVLEIRLMVKNNIQQYTGMHVDLPDPFYAFTDSESAVAAGSKYIGGNVRVGAHIYAENEVATINRVGTFICAVETGKNPSDYAVPPIVSGNGTLLNVPIGHSWDVYVSGDMTRGGWGSPVTVDLTNAENGDIRNI